METGSAPAPSAEALADVAADPASVGCMPAMPDGQLSERDCGIDCYLNDCEPFTFVFRERYTDFIVHEIDRDGTVVTLKDQRANREQEDASADAKPADASVDAPPADASADAPPATRAPTRSPPTRRPPTRAPTRRPPARRPPTRRPPTPERRRAAGERRAHRRAAG